MDFGNLYNREVKALEDDVVFRKEKMKLDWPNGMKAFDETQNDISLTELLELEDKYFSSQLQKIRDRFLTLEGESHYWVGINPKPGTISLAKLYSKMRECAGKYKFFSHGHLYCLEQHTKHGLRPHIHLMLTTNTKPHRIIDTLAKHFNLEKNFIECQKHKHGLMFEEHIKYIKGDKREEKQDDVKKDTADLEEFGIPKYLGKL